ncbi:MAG: SCO family protein [Limisphaerales bacterium]
MNRQKFRPRRPSIRCWITNFTNELGQAVSLNSFRGQALAITFFYTRCHCRNTAPRLSKNFQEASQKLAAMTNAPTNCIYFRFPLTRNLTRPKP